MSVVMRKWRPTTLPLSHAEIVQMHFWVSVFDQEALTAIDKNIRYLMTLHQ